MHLTVRLAGDLTLLDDQSQDAISGPHHGKPAAADSLSIGFGTETLMNHIWDVVRRNFRRDGKTVGAY